MTLSLLLLTAAAGLTGLLAGLYFAFTTAVMPGLADTEDQVFVTAMRRMNARILNGWFLAVFLGAPLLAAAAAVAALTGDGVPAPGWTVAGAVLVVSGLLITGRINVPLNEALAAAGDPAAARRDFERRWVRWNLVRTLATTAGLAALLAGLAVRV